MMWVYLADAVARLRAWPRLDLAPDASDAQVLAAPFPGLRYVWLRRQDKLRQAISLWRANATIFAGAGVDTAFAFTFASYSYPYDPDPHRDLDLAAYGLVTCYRDRRGTSYPDMAWEPKQAFHAYACWSDPDAQAQSRPS